MTEMKKYRVVWFKFWFRAELVDEYAHLGVDPYQLEATPLSSFGDKEEAEKLLGKLRVKYPEAKLGLQSSFVGGCRLAAGAVDALENDNIFRVSKMDAYEGVPASPSEDDEHEDDEY